MFDGMRSSALSPSTPIIIERKAAYPAAVEDPESSNDVGTVLRANSRVPHVSHPAKYTHQRFTSYLFPNTPVTIHIHTHPIKVPTEQVVDLVTGAQRLMQENLNQNPQLPIEPASFYHEVSCTRRLLALAMNSVLAR
jgi:hypothetical protein